VKNVFGCTLEIMRMYLSMDKKQKQDQLIVKQARSKPNCLLKAIVAQSQLKLKASNLICEHRWTSIANEFYSWEQTNIRYNEMANLFTYFTTVQFFWQLCWWLILSL
jgi:hypothetical protein